MVGGETTLNVCIQKLLSVLTTSWQSDLWVEKKPSNYLEASDAPSLKQQFMIHEMSEMAAAPFGQITI